GAQRYNSIIDSLTEQLQRATQQQTGQPETTDDAETLRAMLERCQGQLKKINRQMVENKRGTAILLREKEAEITRCNNTVEKLKKEIEGLATGRTRQ
ncbi:MAG: hypothetical protein ACPG7E_07690, partial [Marinirhabdus sp.]